MGSFATVFPSAVEDASKIFVDEVASSGRRRRIIFTEPKYYTKYLFSLIFQFIIKIANCGNRKRSLFQFAQVHNLPSIRCHFIKIW